MFSDAITNFLLEGMAQFSDLLQFDFSMAVEDSEYAPTLFTKGEFTFVTDAMYHRVVNTCLSIGDKISKGIVVPFLLLFIILEIFWEIVSHTIGDDGVQNFTLRQPIFILLMLIIASNYGPIAKRIDNLSNAVVNHTTQMSAGGEDELEKMQELSNFIFARVSAGEKFGMKEHAKPLENTDAQLKEILKTAQAMKDQEAADAKASGKKVEKEDVGFFSGLAAASDGGAMGVIDYIVELVCSAIMWLARALIELFAWLIGSIILAIAPIAMLAWAIPGGVGKMSLKNTMGTFFQAKIWVIVICVIDLLYTKTYTLYFLDRISNYANGGENSALQLLMGTVMALSFLLIYLAVPKITSVLMAAGSASGMKSAGQDSAKSGAAMGKKAASSIKAVATSGASLAVAAKSKMSGK